MRKLLIAACLLTLAATAWAGEKKMFPFPAGPQDEAALNAGLPAKEYGYHPMDSRDYGESWYFLATNDAGDQIWILYSVSNYHPLYKFAGTIDLFYYPAAGGQAVGHAECKKDDIDASLTDMEASICGSTVKRTGNPREYVLDGNTDKIQLDLTYTGQTADFVLGQDYVYFGEDKDTFWTAAVITPRAKVKGTITVGGKTIDFDGVGYFDHGRCDERIYKFSQWWYVLRVITDDFSLGAMQMVMKDDYAPREANVIHLTYGDKVIANSGALNLSHSGSYTDEESEVTYPDTFKVSYDGGGTKLEGTVKFERQTQGLNVLNQLSPFVRKLAKALVTDPWQFRLAGTADLTLTVDGETVRIQAPAIGEVHNYK